MAFNKAVIAAEAASLDWVRVSSSNLAAAAYSGLGGPGRMYVRFKNGSTYVYDAVPRGVFDGLVSAPSKGKYLHAVVKPNYYFERVG